MLTPINQSLSLPAKEAPAAIRLRKTCAEFESLFIAYLMKSMRTTSSDSSFFGSKNSADIVKSMFDENVSKEIAKGGGIGLGRILFEQLNDRL